MDEKCICFQQPVPLPKEEGNEPEHVATESTSSQGESDTTDVAPRTKGKIPKGAKSSPSARLHKTKFCMFYLQGACTLGERCRFAHNTAEMHSAPEPRKTKAATATLCADKLCISARGQQYGQQGLHEFGAFFKKSLCMWFEQGVCRNGDSCSFAHGAKELRAAGGARGLGESGCERKRRARLGDQILAKARAPPGLEVQAPWKLELASFIALAGVAQPTPEPASVSMKESIADMERQVFLLAEQVSALEKKTRKAAEVVNGALEPQAKHTALSSRAACFIPGRMQSSCVPSSRPMLEERHP